MRTFQLLEKNYRLMQIVEVNQLESLHKTSEPQKLALSQIEFIPISPSLLAFLPTVQSLDGISFSDKKMSWNLPKNARETLFYIRLRRPQVNPPYCPFRTKSRTRKTEDEWAKWGSGMPSPRRGEPKMSRMRLGDAVPAEGEGEGEPNEARECRPRRGGGPTMSCSRKIL